MPSPSDTQGHEMSGGGGWRGGGGPWGQGPRNSGGGQTPDLEELLRRSQDRLRRVLPGRGGSGRGISPLAIVIIAIIAVALLGYNFFTFRVEPNEVGVVLRFGVENRKVDPGLNFRLPYPIETVYTPAVTRVNRVTVGLLQTDNNTISEGGPAQVAESLMLTGDENIVDIDFSVFWQIKDAASYLFHLQNPDTTVKAVAESAMREVVGRSNIQPLLTQARTVTETDVQRLMQETLDAYGAGIDITQVQLLKVDPPAQVIDAFRDVQAARADQERKQNEAQTYANQVVPQARGQAAQIIEAANAYRQQTVAEAQGAAERFLQVYAAYAEAPAVTRERLYLETLVEVLRNANKVVVDTEDANGVIPYLPLPQLAPRTTTTTTGIR